MSAAQLVVSWSHPGRFRSEAAFASLAGVCPIEASSGRITRHRLTDSIASAIANSTEPYT
ncbi:MAG: transposase [Pseudonocardiales bacterium]|nr:transposase [Pseudonocardiales bacterium]